MQYDAAIIGADADGLAAAVTLARSGFKVIVLEQNSEPGGRCVTREFHPGFRASPFCDEIAPIPPEIFWSLGLARRGVVFMPALHSTAIWPDRANVMRRGDPLLKPGQTIAAAAYDRAKADVAAKPKMLPWIRKHEADAPWPAESWNTASLDEALAAKTGDRDAVSHAMAMALSGRAAHPDLAGTALHLLAPGIGGSGLVAGGLQRLTDALVGAAQDAGVEISCGLEVADIQRVRGKVRGVQLADGSLVDARAVLSTLDLKRTFLSLFAWNDLPRDVAERVAAFRMAGSSARLLVALKSLPGVPQDCDSALFEGAVQIAPACESFGGAYTAWRQGIISDRPPVSLRFPSVMDPGLCEPGTAVMTATVGCVPLRLFDGSWTHEKRDALRDVILATIQNVFPQIRDHMLGCELIVPPDMEASLGLSDGDLWGGEIASDQMFSMRAWRHHAGPRTPIDGVYLAGPSSAAGPLGTCAAGVIAANAIAADLGRPK